MSKLELKLPEGQARGKVVARVRGRTSKGKKTMQTVVLNLGGEASTIDVEPGHVGIQVQLPSGEILSQQATFKHADETQSITFAQKPSRQKWLGWQNVLTPQVQRAKPPAAGTFVKSARVYVKGKPSALGPVTNIDGAQLRVETDAKTFSLTIENYRGERLLVELVHGTQRDVAVAPVPWFDEFAHPLPVQMILEESEEGMRADVVVQDPEL
jgi:hypothetical protein